nr:pyroglutamyl peptidase [Nocardiopsis mwathae]
MDAPQLLLRRSGFGAAAPLFSADLAGAGSLDVAEQVVTSHGRRLWSEAVRESGDVIDDRPLYWARLTLSARLRSWQPEFTLDERERGALLTRLEHASRGHDDLVFAPGDRQLRVIVTGFDPFDLDTDVRASNPSGVAALTLHDATFDIGGYTAVVRTALFPVRWRDFTDGMVERVLLPHYTADPGSSAAADAVITVSQGREGRFDLEAHNAAWRGGRADNEGRTAPGPVPLGAEAPRVDPRPEWSTSSLPRRAIVAQATGRFPVHDNTAVTEIPAGEGPEGSTVHRPNGPTPGSWARGGGGGDYLSNEIAYRNTLLRDAIGRPLPAGHVHTPALHPGSADPATLTDPAFERDRADIVGQLRAIIAAALRPTAQG